MEQLNSHDNDDSMDFIETTVSDSSEYESDDFRRRRKPNVEAIRNNTAENNRNSKSATSTTAQCGRS